MKLKDASFHLEQDESHVVSRNPYMALDQIDFRRDQASDAELRANVRFTLFLRKKK